MEITIRGYDIVDNLLVISWTEDGSELEDIFTLTDREVKFHDSLDVEARAIWIAELIS